MAAINEYGVSLRQQLYFGTMTFTKKFAKKSQLFSTSGLEALETRPSEINGGFSCRFKDENFGRKIDPGPPVAQVCMHCMFSRKNTEIYVRFENFFR